MGLPGFLKPSGGSEAEDVFTGLKMTGYFLEHWVFNHHSRGVPDARLLFQQRFAKTVENKEMSEHVAG